MLPALLSLALGALAADKPAAPARMTMAQAQAAEKVAHDQLDEDQKLLDSADAKVVNACEPRGPACDAAIAKRAPIDRKVKADHAALEEAFTKVKELQHAGLGSDIAQAEQGKAKKGRGASSGGKKKASGARHRRARTPRSTRRPDASATSANAPQSETGLK